MNGRDVFFIMHHSEENTRDVFYYSWKCSQNGDVTNYGTVSAPMGISLKDALDNDFTTHINIDSTREGHSGIFSMFKA